MKEGRKMAGWGERKKGRKEKRKKERKSYTTKAVFLQIF
jgi:hypothetical protein